MALAAKGSGRFVPIARAGLTSATLMAVSDMACQTVQQRMAGRRAQLDLHRTARFSLIGLTMHGPL